MSSAELLNEVEEQFQESVRKFVDSEIVPHAQRWDREVRYPRELLGRLGEWGGLGTAFPGEHGGGGGGSGL